MSSYDVTYLDGRTERVSRRPIHLVRAERICPDGAGLQEQTMLMVWAAATGGTGTFVEFENWLDGVSDWERVPEPKAEAEGEDNPPPEPGGSPD